MRRPTESRSHRENDPRPEPRRSKQRMLNRETKTKKYCQRHTTAYPRGGIRSCRLYNVPTSITRLVGDSSDPSACEYTVPSLRLTDTASEAITPQGPDRTRECANQLCTESSSSTHEDNTPNAELGECHSALTRDATNAARLHAAKSCHPG